MRLCEGSVVSCEAHVMFIFWIFDKPKAKANAHDLYGSLQSDRMSDTLILLDKQIQ